MIKCLFIIYIISSILINIFIKKKWFYSIFKIIFSKTFKPLLCKTHTYILIYLYTYILIWKLL